MKPAIVRSIMTKAASNSLKVSVREIEAYLEGNGVSLPGPVRAELHDALEELSARWYRRGFNRGHRESFERYEATGAVPQVLRANVRRDLFSGNRQRLKLNSKLKGRR